MFVGGFSFLLWFMMMLIVRLVGGKFNMVMELFLGSFKFGVVRCMLCFKVVCFFFLLYFGIIRVINMFFC